MSMWGVSAQTKVCAGGQLFEAKHFSVGCAVGAGSGEIVEGTFRRFDDVPRNEWRAFCGALFAALDAAFPFENGPTVEAVLREL